MILICFFFFFAITNAQITAIVSHYGGYTFEYHPETHLITVRNIYDCYFVTTNKHLGDSFTNTATRGERERELLSYITNHQHTSKTSLVQSTLDHRDASAISSCVGRNLYELKYPSGGATTQRTTTLGTKTVTTNEIKSTSST